MYGKDTYYVCVVRDNGTGEARQTVYPFHGKAAAEKTVKACEKQDNCIVAFIMTAEDIEHGNEHMLEYMKES